MARRGWLGPRNGADELLRRPDITDPLERLARGKLCLGGGMTSYQGRCPKCGRAFGPGKMPEHKVVHIDLTASWNPNMRRHRGVG